MQRENLKKGIMFSLIGNILFIAFALVCLVYYYTYSIGSVHSKILEIMAYAVEIGGFGLLLYSDYLLIISLRLRRMMKIIYSIYIVVEIVMMVLELWSSFIDDYAPYSLTLAIVHAIISGVTCFSFLQLDPENKRFEYLIIASVAVVLAGMMGNIMGIRVYFSIALNAVGMALLFGGIKYLMDHEQIDIDCNGDRAAEAVYNSSTIFGEPKAAAKPVKKEQEVTEPEPEEVTEPEPEETDEPEPAPEQKPEPEKRPQQNSGSRKKKSGKKPENGKK